MNWKNDLTDEIISDECYNKLPTSKQINYSEVEDEPTHKVDSRDRTDDDDDGFFTTAITALAIDSIMDSSSSFDSGDSSGGSFGGFSGGDSGGGGASGDW